MRLVYSAFFVFAVFMCGGCGSQQTPPTGSASKANSNNSHELESLHGTWQVIAIEAAGKPVPSERVKKINLQYVFDGNKVTIRRPDRPDNSMTFTLDETTNPKKITMNQNPPLRAVYALEGNKLRLCLMVDESPNAGYPTELVSKAEPKSDLLTLERR